MLSYYAEFGVCQLLDGRTGKNSSHDTHLYKLCDEAGIKRFCIHALWHTNAT